MRLEARKMSKAKELTQMIRNLPVNQVESLELPWPRARARYPSTPSAITLNNTRTAVDSKFPALRKTNAMLPKSRLASVATSCCLISMLKGKFTFVHLFYE